MTDWKHRLDGKRKSAAPKFVRPPIMKPACIHGNDGAIFVAYDPTSFVSLQLLTFITKR